MKKIAFELKIENQLTEIVKVINHFETFAKDHKISQKLVNMINIAFDELLNNTISYGYLDKEEHEIIVKVKIINKDLIIELIDDAVAFDPFQTNPPDTSLSLEEREIGGLGIHIVKTIMDDCSYLRKDEKNIVTLKKSKII